MPFPNDRTYSVDANLIFSDGLTALTASGVSTVGGVPQTLDLGGNQGTSPLQQARFEAVAIVDVTAIKVSSLNETYLLMVNVSNDPAFGAGNVVNAGAMLLSAINTGSVVNSQASVTGRYELMFTNNIAGSLYEYGQLYVVVGGTTPSITFDSFVAVMPEP